MLRSFIFLILIFTGTAALAAQEAIVVAEKALIFADQKMTSPIGYVRRGKRIKVGEVPRNHARVYPIVVSGRIAYIQVRDVSTERDALDPTRLVAERFRQATKEERHSRYSLSYLSYASQISMDKDNGNVTDGDSLSWMGVSLKGEILFIDPWDFQVLLNVLTAEEGEEEFRAIEFGIGTSYRFFESSRFTARVEAQLLGVPFSSYAFGSKFRVNGYGYTVGAGLNLSYRFTEHWGADAYGGVYYTGLSGFDTPDPFNSIAPSFFGNRIGLGAYYTF